MAILADTNTLLRWAQPHHPQCALVDRALAALSASGEEFCVTVQNCVEFWSVATRAPNQNGLGMTPEAAARELAAVRESFIVLGEPKRTLHLWEHLVSTYGVSGKAAHDARLVAVMLQNGVRRILTFNTADLARYEAEGIEALHPENVPPLTSSAASQ